MYNIHTSFFDANVFVYAENLICVEIKNGGSHPDSKALLALEEIKNQFEEYDDSFFIGASRLSVRISKLYSSASFYMKDEQLAHFKYHKSDSDHGFELEFTIEKGEHIYGLGEDNDIAFGRLDRRGTVRDMLTGQRINQNHVTADFPIPFTISSGVNKPYGVYLDNTSNLTVDVCSKEDDILKISAPCGACRLYFISGDSIPEIVGKYSEITGRAALPPLWVLGYMQSKCSFWNWEEIDDVIETFAKNNIPLDSIVFDFDWAQYFNNYKWADRWEGKSAEKIKYYREKYGIHFMASNSGPMLKEDSDTFESAVKAGVLAHDTEGNTVTCGHYSGKLMDFTNPEAQRWLYPQIENVMKDGIEAWWLDLTEPEGDAENTVYYIGDRAQVHNIFSNAVTECYHSIMNRFSSNKRSFVLTRTGTAGIQRKPTALWTGDIYSEYGTLRAHIPEALNTQLCGISMWTCDTGGFLLPTNNESCPYNLYHNDRTEHAGLYERWLQFSCFSPILRTHHAGGESVPYRYNGITFDGIAHYIRLRYRLIPYIYSLYYENHLNGTPIMRPLFWHYPSDDRAYEINDEYLFGENMLIAPVLEGQKNFRKVYLPQGRWYDFDYDYLYEGGKEYEVYAPQNRIPVFVKAGAVIPMSPEVTNTRQIDFKRLEALIYPNGRSEGCIYADDGITDNYLKGEYTATKIICNEMEDSLKINIKANNDYFSVEELIFHIHMKQTPIRVMLNDKEAIYTGRLTSLKCSDEGAFYFDEFNRILHVKMLLNGSENVVEILLDRDKRFSDFKPFCEENIAGQLPYIYPPAAIPCVIEAIHYDRGGEGVAFHKNVSSQSNIYRDDNAGIGYYEDKLCIKNLQKGEWLEYSVSCAKEGTYEVLLEGDLNGAKKQISIDGSTQLMVDSKANIKVGTGQKTLRLEVADGCADIFLLRILRR